MTDAPDTAPSTLFIIGETRPDRITTVVDVGANPIHDIPYKPLLDMGGCRVFGFEPQPDAFARLMEIRTPNEHYLPYAVGNGSQIDLRLYQSSGMTSVFDPYMPSYTLLGAPKLARIRDRVTLPTVALDRMEEIPAFDLLKIDIQGGEVEVFRGAAAKLATVAAVIVELRYLQLYEGEPMLAGVDLDLRSRGFILHKFLFNKSMAVASSQTHRLRPKFRRDQLVDGDAVYIRDPSTISDMDTETVKHLAILASGVFDSHPLALACLDELARRGVVSAGTSETCVELLPDRMRMPAGEAPAS